MARVEIKEYREQYAHFGLYRTSAGGDESIIVRRKVGEPTDYMHTKSRKLKRQRDNLTLASQHYAHLTPSQKAITRHQIEEVEYQKSHGKTDIKLLMGRQLFVSKEMRSLQTTGKQLELPHQICIMLVDQFLNPLVGQLWLRYLKDEEWLDIRKEELTTGNWLFSQTPRGQEAYRPYGQSPGYYDPMLPQHQFMTEDKIRAYHYHKLTHEIPKICYHHLNVYVATILRQGTKWSQPILPYCSFKLQEFWICLMRRPDPYYTPPATGFISIHHTTQEAKPIDPPIASSSFTIDVPNLYEYRWHRIPFPSLTLEAGTLYSWVLGAPGDYDWYFALNVICGELGYCNPIPKLQRWTSRRYEGSWQPWQEYPPYDMFYEARGEALP